MKMVIVMRTDLNMRKGKMIAQGGHGVIYSYTEALGSTSKRQNLFRWLEEGQRKICVGIGSEAELLDLHYKALDLDVSSVKVTDLGVTEFHGVPTNTCVVIGPDEGEKVDAITSNLKLL